MLSEADFCFCDVLLVNDEGELSQRDFCAHTLPVRFTLMPPSATAAIYDQSRDGIEEDTRVSSRRAMVFGVQLRAMGYMEAKVTLLPTVYPSCYLVTVFI